MTKESYEENLYLLESYRSARGRLYAYMRRLEERLRASVEPSETDSLERRLLTLYGELDDTAEAIRALESYCLAAREKGLVPDGEERETGAEALLRGDGAASLEEAVSAEGIPAEREAARNPASEREYAGDILSERPTAEISLSEPETAENVLTKRPTAEISLSELTGTGSIPSEHPMTEIIPTGLPAEDGCRPATGDGCRTSAEDGCPHTAARPRAHARREAAACRK